MKSLASLVVLGLLAGSASAAEPQISRSTLASIGLPGFTKMSNADAMTVRGKSYAVYANGTSYATSILGHSTNSYSASLTGNYGSHNASGYSVSGAFTGVGSSYGYIVIGTVAGGTSSASVH